MEVLLDGLRVRLESVLTEEMKQNYKSPQDLESLTMAAIEKLNLSIAELAAIP